MKKTEKSKLFNSFSIMVIGIIGVIGLSFGSIIFKSIYKSDNATIESGQKRCANCSAKAGIDVFHSTDNSETEEVWCETHKRFETRAINSNE